MQLQNTVVNMSIAIKAYEKVMKQKHTNFHVKTCGTFINKKYPWLHATPDFLCYCDCCGEGCGEVKCPCCLKDTHLKDYPEKSNSCLKSENGATSLKRGHAYYYQSQQQIFTTGYNYCDFVVCGFNEQIAFFCERILPDICHWNSVVPKLNHFWRYCVLPEILGRWYTQKRNVSQPSSGLSSVCFCRMNTADTVVTCSNQACPISSFHLTCLSKKYPTSGFVLCAKKLLQPGMRNQKANKQTRKFWMKLLNWTAYVCAKRSHCLQINS